MLEPNLRGTAPRNIDKRVRVATHEPVVRECFALVKPRLVIEHGMGISSTPLFHSLAPQKLLSFEDIPQWQICACDKTMHTIVTWSLDVLNAILRGVDPVHVLGFVDGISCQRSPMLQMLLEHDVVCVIEHDAEWTSADELVFRKNLCEKHGYDMKQYVLLNPETFVYMKRSYSLLGEGYVTP